MLVIDGSMGEGGGQILRTALALSAVTGQSVRITNIRAKRRNPGLQRQHLTAVQALATICNARVHGASLGSTVLEFHPGGLRAGSFEFDIGTAGSVTLVLQALAPSLFFLPGDTRIVITGGTDVPWSPTIDYARFIFVPLLRRLGLRISVELLKRGHYPRGGGKVIVSVEDPPHEVKNLWLPERGRILEIRGVSHCVNLPQHVCERQRTSSEGALRRSYPNTPMTIDVDHRMDGLGPGSGVTLWALTEHSVLGSDSLGERGKRAETVGEEAAARLVEDLGTNAALDRFMSDMIVPFLMLAKGKSLIRGARLTLHAVTNVEVARIIVRDARVELRGEHEAPFTLEVEGSPPLPKTR